MTICLTHPLSQAEWSHARHLVGEYVASLSLDLSFQNIAYELDNFSSEYGPPRGAFLLAEENGGYVGCVDLRALDERSAEIKRLYVSSLARGRGVCFRVVGAPVGRSPRLRLRRPPARPKPETIRHTQRLLAS